MSTTLLWCSSSPAGWDPQAARDVAAARAAVSRDRPKCMLPVLNHVRDTISWEPPPSCIILQMMAVHGQIIYFQPPIDDGLHKGKVQHISQSALWLFASGNLRNSVGECDRYFGKPPPSPVHGNKRPHCGEPPSVDDQMTIVTPTPQLDSSIRRIPRVARMEKGNF